MISDVFPKCSENRGISTAFAPHTPIKAKFDVHDYSMGSLSHAKMMGEWGWVGTWAQKFQNVPNIAVFPRFFAPKGRLFMQLKLKFGVYIYAHILRSRSHVKFGPDGQGDEYSWLSCRFYSDSAMLTNSSQFMSVSRGLFQMKKISENAIGPYIKNWTKNEFKIIKYSSL